MDFHADSVFKLAITNKEKLVKQFYTNLYFNPFSLENWYTAYKIEHIVQHYDSQYEILKYKCKSHILSKKYISNVY